MFNHELKDREFESVIISASRCFRVGSREGRMEVSVKLHANVVGHYDNIASVSRLPGTRREAAIHQGRRQVRYNRDRGKMEGARGRGRRRCNGQAVHNHSGV
jgi:hypothetical protein